jgi:hypothetical protein
MIVDFAPIASKLVEPISNMSNMTLNEIRQAVGQVDENYLDEKASEWHPEDFLSELMPTTRASDSMEGRLMIVFCACPQSFKPFLAQYML